MQEPVWEKCVRKDPGEGLPGAGSVRFFGQGAPWDFFADKADHFAYSPESTFGGIPTGTQICCTPLDGLSAVDMAEPDHEHLA